MSGGHFLADDRAAGNTVDVGGRGQGFREQARGTQEMTRQNNNRGFSTRPRADVRLVAGRATTSISANRATVPAPAGWPWLSARWLRRRGIRISRSTVIALQRHRDRMITEGRDVASGPVFVGVRGAWLSQPTVYRRVWRPILKQAGLRHFTPYVTRHTMACLLLSSGVNIKVVSRRLGHEDISTTLKHYVHVMPDMEEQAVEAIETLFRRQ